MGLWKARNPKTGCGGAGAGFGKRGGGISLLTEAKPKKGYRASLGATGTYIIKRAILVYIYIYIESVS